MIRSNCWLLSFNPTEFFFPASPWGAGTFAGPDGSRQPSALEHEIARIQGESFGECLARITL